MGHYLKGLIDIRDAHGLSPRSAAVGGTTRSS